MKARALAAATIVLAGAAFSARAAEAPPDFDARLRARLAKALADPCLAKAQVGLDVRDATTGAALFESGALTPLAPASNMKILTSAAAEELLGPERTLETRFLADKRPDATGTVGTLYVVGRGDPSLTIEGLYLAARALASAGVRKVDAVVVDDSYLAGPERVPSWPQRNWGTWYGAPSGGLSCNFNVVSVHARGGKAGEAAAAWIDPFPTFFRIESTVRTGSGPWQVDSSLAPDATGEVHQVLALKGRVAAGQTQRALEPVDDPALFCGHGVAESLRRVGVEVSGQVRRGLAPATAPTLHVHESAPLALLLHDMNKVSSNVFAETMLKVLGAEFSGAPGTREKGLDVLRAWLARVSPGDCACKLEDGSGLSPEGRLNARLLTNVLLSMRSSYAGPEFLVSLPVSGIDGTLRRRLRDDGVSRLVRAKTGRISQVAALSGVARIADGRDAVFSLLVNAYHCPTWKVEGAVDRVIEALVAEAPPAPKPLPRLDLPPASHDIPVNEGQEQDDGATDAPAAP